MMRKQIYYTLLIGLLWNTGLSAQHEVSKPLMEKIKKVFAYGQEGYKNLDAKPLLKAAKILIKHPEIQQFSETGAVDGDMLEEEDGGDYKSFFNPEILIADAKGMVPVDAKILKWRIRQLEKKLPNYKEMSLKMKENGGDIQVKNYIIYSKNSKTISTSFKSNQKIILSVRVGNDLRLSVFDKKTKQRVGKSQFIGDARMVSFTAEAAAEYQIKIENVASQPNDCLLMIETK